MHQNTAFPVVPFVDLPGVSQNSMLFVNHLKSYPHNVNAEVNQTFFFICEDDRPLATKTWYPGT